MAERFKAHAWRACILSGIVGSNPTLSARLYRLKKGKNNRNKKCKFFSYKTSNSH